MVSIFDNDGCKVRFGCCLVWSLVVGKWGCLGAGLGGFMVPCVNHCNMEGCVAHIVSVYNC